MSTLIGLTNTFCIFDALIISLLVHFFYIETCVYRCVMHICKNNMPLFPDTNPVWKNAYPWLSDPSNTQLLFCDNYISCTVAVIATLPQKVVPTCNSQYTKKCSLAHLAHEFTRVFQPMNTDKEDNPRKSFTVGSFFFFVVVARTHLLATFCLVSVESGTF